MNDWSRRTMITATAGLLASASARGASGSRPEKAPRGRAAPPGRNSAVGKPVSETAAAQGGTPVVPAPPPPPLRIALVGIGKLTAEELLPAFRQSERCKVAGFVSGDREKARAFAAVHGVPEKSVYTYDEMDRLRDDDGTGGEGVDRTRIGLGHRVTPSTSPSSTEKDEKGWCEGA